MGGMTGSTQSIRANGLVSPTESTSTCQINSNGLTAEKWTAKLESITGRDDLRFLTFLPLQQCVSIRATRHSHRAWCPSCLDNQRSENGTIYEHLLWSLKYVTACPIHTLTLQTKCPHCGLTSGVLQGSMRPGACAKCNGWLGALRDTSRAINGESESATTEYEIFAADQIGRLIAASRSVQFELTGQTSKRAIRNCIDQCFDGNVNSFVRYVGLGKSAATQFGKKHLVGLQLLLRIAYATRVSVLDLLNDENALSGFSTHISVNATKGLLSLRRNGQGVLALLKAATTEMPPPSISEVATRLGYSSSYKLPRQFKDICNLITANFQNSQRGREARSFSRTRLQTDEAIEAALRAAMKRRSPSSLKQVAKSLGYTTAMAITVRFPDLCQALVEKRQNPLRARKNRIKAELEKSLKNDPPETVLAIGKRLGYQSNAPLRSAYPELCRKIRIRFKKHNQGIFLSNARRTLKMLLTETPPPSLKAALLRLDVSDGWLRKYFPDAHRSLASRYLEFRREQSVMNKTKNSEKLRSIVRQLHDEGTFPSMNAVMDVFTVNTLSLFEVWPIIKKEREALLDAR